MKRLIFRTSNTVQVFRLGKTSNKKIAEDKAQIVQTYTYSKDQFNYIADCVNNELSTNFQTFFSLDSANCFDCPFSGNQNEKAGFCYTHKFTQYSGFISQLKSIVNTYGNFEAIPLKESINLEDFSKLSNGKYVRFGTYGEPSMHGIDIVEAMTKTAKNWTGYTHQYFRKPEYNQFFMASTHNEQQAKTAKEKFGYRSFIATKDNSAVQAVICPASKEAGFKSNCSKCGLCSGIKGKGNKNIVILEH